MTTRSIRLLILTLALVALASVPALSAPNAAPLASPDLLPIIPVDTVTEDAGDTAPVADTDPRAVAWEEPALAVRPQGVTPDGSFTDPQSLAGVRQLDAGLAKTSPSNAPGIYMARDWRALSQADFPMLVGGHDMFQWSDLEPTEGTYNWTRLDNMIAANTASGKKTAFGLTAYNGRIENGIVVPDWLKTNYPQAIITCSGDGWQIPRYWNSVYKTKYTQLVQAMSTRYKNNSNVAWVQIGVGLYGEIQPADDRDDTCVKTAMAADGRTDYSAFWSEILNSYIDIFMIRYNTGKPVFLVYTPTFVDRNEKCYATQYGAGKYGMGLFSGGVYANTADIFNAWPSITYPGGCRKWDPIAAWNNSPTATIPVAFETYRYMLPNLDQFYWGMMNALNKHPDYLNLESDLFFSNKNDPWGSKITENFPMMYFANQYLGKTLATTPNVWTAMREYDPATNSFGFHNAYVKPQFGNYDFWLTQDNTVAGGRTVSATTVNQYCDTSTVPCTLKNDIWYDPLLAGKGPQGWITRRTGHSSGNDYFYLNINDTFASTRLQAASVITVTWFDVITSTGAAWFLEYKDIGGNTQSRQVNRSNSKQWKTTTFNISDADFNNQFSGSDFRLYNGGVADLYVHFVAVGPATSSPPATVRVVLPIILSGFTPP